MTELSVAFLDRLRALEGSYLRETDPIRQSGFGGGHERWRTERELVLDAVPDDGDFLDVGCANGYLLECLVQWGYEQHVRLTPYGVDCSAQLVALAQQRLPQYASHFWVANAWEWLPPRQFRYVYSLYDCVPEELLPAYIRRLVTRYVEAGGTLIMGAYGSYSKQEAARDIATDIAAAGFRVAGSSSRGALPVARVAWIQAEQAHGADALQRPLRSRFQQQVSASVSQMEMSCVKVGLSEPANRRSQPSWRASLAARLRGWCAWTRSRPTPCMPSTRTGVDSS